MNQKRSAFIKKLIEGLAGEKSQLEEKITRAQKEMQRASAREKGSWSDHSIRDAEEKLSVLAQHLKEIKNQIKEVKVLAKQKTSSKKAVRGSAITIEIDGEKQTFLLVNSSGNPEQRLLSVHSPIGKALLGKRAGQTFTLSTPTGSLKVKVLKIN